MTARVATLGAPIDVRAGGRLLRPSEILLRAEISPGREIRWPEDPLLPVMITREPDRLRRYWVGLQGCRPLTSMRKSPTTLGFRMDGDMQIEWWFERVEWIFPGPHGWSTQYDLEFIAELREPFVVGKAVYVDGPSSHPKIAEFDPEAQRTIGGWWRL